MKKVFAFTLDEEMVNSIIEQGKLEGRSKSNAINQCLIRGCGIKQKPLETAIEAIKNIPVKEDVILKPKEDKVEDIMIDVAGTVLPIEPEKEEVKPVVLNSNLSPENIKEVVRLKKEISELQDKETEQKKIMYSNELSTVKHKDAKWECGVIAAKIKVLEQQLQKLTNNYGYI